MIDLIKKAMFTGIGVAALTKEKVEDVATDFIEQGKMSEQEGKKLVDEIMVKSKESQEELAQKIEASVNIALEKLAVAKESDIEALQQQIDELKEKLKE